MEDDDMDYHLNDIDKNLRSSTKKKFSKILVFLIVLSILIMLSGIVIIIIMGIKNKDIKEELEKIKRELDKAKQKNENINDNNIDYDFYGTKFINLSYAIDGKIENTFKENGINYNKSRGIINNNKDYIANDRSFYDLYIPQYSLENKNNYNGIILWLHGGAWIMGNKEQMNSFIKNYIQNGYIIANMGYTLLNSVYKDANIFRILDEVRACIKSIRNKLVNKEKFDGNKLGLGIGGGSAGGHISLLYSYLMKDSPIPVKFVMDYCGPIGLDPKYFTHLANNSEPLNSIENLIIIQQSLENKKIVENKGSEFLINLMNGFLGNIYSKEFINSIMVNGSINKTNSNYTELLNKVKFADITYVNDESKCPTICFYTGRDNIAGLSHFAYLNERAKGERIIKFVYSKYIGHEFNYDHSTKETENDGKYAIKMWNYYIYDFAKSYFKEN